MTSVAKLTGRGVRVKKNVVSPYTFLLPDTLMGVEVEVDSDQAFRSVFPSVDSSVWVRHHDGSLNNGFEFTLARPMAGNELGHAIHHLFAPPAEFYRTFTGSTHIHMDMLEEEVTLDVLRTLVLLVYVLEPMLFQAGDLSREWCGYSNSLKAAQPMLLSVLFSDSVADSFLQTYSRGSRLGRYYGLNLAALTDYGSLEFRYFPTATTAEELVGWVNMVQAFKKAALEIGTPANLAAIISNEESYQNMLTEYFGAFNESCTSVRNWQAAHSAFVKAQIVSKDDALPVASAVDAEAIFANNRFSNLVTYTPMSETTINVINNGQVPRGDVGPYTILVYAGRVYIRNGRGNSWVSILEDSHSLLRDTDMPPAVFDELSVIAADTVNFELSARERSAVNNFIHSGSIIQTDANREASANEWFFYRSPFNV